MFRLFGVLIIGSKSDAVCVLSHIAEGKIFGMIAHLKNAASCLLAALFKKANPCIKQWVE